MRKILTIITLIAITLIGCSEQEQEINYSSNKFDIGKYDLSYYNIPNDAKLDKVIKTSGNPAVTWTYMHTCYMTTISRTYYGSFVSNTFTIPCK